MADETKKPLRWNWKVAGIVSLLFVVIVVSVIVTDALSVRNRNYPAPTTTSTQP